MSRHGPPLRSSASSAPAPATSAAQIPLPSSPPADASMAMDVDLFAHHSWAQQEQQQLPLSLQPSQFAVPTPIFPVDIQHLQQLPLSASAAAAAALDATSAASASLWTSTAAPFATNLLSVSELRVASSLTSMSPLDASATAILPGSTGGGGPDHGGSSIGTAEFATPTTAPAPPSSARRIRTVVVPARADSPPLADGESAADRDDSRLHRMYERLKQSFARLRSTSPTHRRASTSSASASVSAASSPPTEYVFTLPPPAKRIAGHGHGRARAMSSPSVLPPPSILGLGGAPYANRRLHPLDHHHAVPPGSRRPRSSKSRSPHAFTTAAAAGMSVRAIVSPTLVQQAMARTSLASPTADRHQQHQRNRPSPSHQQPQQPQSAPPPPSLALPTPDFRHSWPSAWQPTAATELASPPLPPAQHATAPPPPPPPPGPVAHGLVDPEEWRVHALFAARAESQSRAPPAPPPLTITAPFPPRDPALAPASAPALALALAPSATVFPASPTATVDAAASVSPLANMGMDPALLAAWLAANNDAGSADAGFAEWARLTSALADPVPHAQQPQRHVHADQLAAAAEVGSTSCSGAAASWYPRASDGGGGDGRRSDAR
ncbi:hypothetical protein H9P43_006526 [Blastocladiella emersonii ATCC 22665]|nr:hypothetical protein H9P43_006526 [Blastocladiella emersonii ATCC 22665]